MEAWLSELKAGPASGRGVFEVLDVGSDADFSFGADMLLRSDLEISVKEKVLRFFLTSNCEKRHLAYWDPEAVAVPFKLYAEDDLRPAFKVKVNGQEMMAMLSTNTSTTTLNMKAAERLGLKVGSPLVKAVGQERISNVKIGMMDLGVNVADLVIGMDFMRAHRIYISMDQQVIYFSYLGGEIFTVSSTATPDWLQAEIDNGNPDALFRMGDKAEDAGDTVSAISWYEKAGAKGNRIGLIRVGMLTYGTGDFARSARVLRAFQKPGPSPIVSPWLYFATARAGDPALALAELKADKALATHGGRYVNVIDYLLQEIDASTLKAMAAKKGATDSQSGCEVGFFIAQNHILQGNPDAARPLLEAAVRECRPTSGAYHAAQFDLARMAR